MGSNNQCELCGDYVIPAGRTVAQVTITDFALVNAAPDLLAALKRVVAVADRKTDEFDAARAAIAKAEGGQAQEVHINRRGCKGPMQIAAKEAIAEAAQKLASAYTPNIIILCPKCGKSTEAPRIATDPPTETIKKLCGNCTGDRHVPKAKRIR